MQKKYGKHRFFTHEMFTHIIIKSSPLPAPLQFKKVQSECNSGSLIFFPYQGQVVQS